VARAQVRAQNRRGAEALSRLPALERAPGAHFAAIEKAAWRGAEETSFSHSQTASSRECRE
jgi:hypothetical protein